MRKLFVFVGAVLGLAGAAQASEPRFETQLEQTLTRALPRMACNLSPTVEKPVWRDVDGKPTQVFLKPAPGSIVASPSFDNPDYYFHWNRDSALVAETLVRFLPHVEGSATAAKLRGFLGDFVRFSHTLQESETPYGLGEVRFNVDGSVDDIFWSRPQHDGPALRAISVLSYLRSEGLRIDPELRRLALEVIARDVNHLSYAWEAKSFDLWEYSFGHHFYTGMVQLGALEQARQALPQFLRKEWHAGIRGLSERLAGHWDTAGGFYHFSRGKVTRADGEEVGEVGGGPDASVVFAVNHSHRLGSELGLLDSKVFQTAWNLEDYFRRAFPINEEHHLGPAIGRHRGDDYYGGNAFFFLTAGYAEFYYRLADHFVKNPGASLVVDEHNLAPLQHTLGVNLLIGEDLAGDAAGRDRLVAALVEKGDAFLRTIMASVGDDGMMAEQFGKADGKPASAVDLTWSYSSFLSAALVREGVKATGIPYGAIPFECVR